jgi:hypothetical protein
VAKTIVQTAPRSRVTRLLTETVIDSLATGTSCNSATAAHRPAAKGPAEAEVRIYRDGLLVAKGYAAGIAPSRLFITVDPLHYPINTRLDVEFVNDPGKASGSIRVFATVLCRSVKGIEVRLDPAPGN